MALLGQFREREQRRIVRFAGRRHVPRFIELALVHQDRNQEIARAIPVRVAAALRIVEPGPE